jgi:D-methionine transport system permease protein
MLDFLKEIFIRTDMAKGILETIYMVIFSTILAYIIGLPLGIAVIVTDKEGIKPNKTINMILSTIINLFRSIPFIILLVLIIPITRLLVGTSIGSTAMIVPLTLASTTFVARLVENSLREIDKALLEQAFCMGAKPYQIIFKIYLVEATPSLIRGLSITCINLLGYSAMAGAVAGGGLGDIAIRFGYYKYNYLVIIITVIILVVIVQIIQAIFEKIAKKVDKKLI